MIIRETEARSEHTNQYGEFLLSSFQKTPRRKGALALCFKPLLLLLLLLFTFSQFYTFNDIPQLVVLGAATCAAYIAYYTYK
jgi:hypothetical protein